MGTRMGSHMPQEMFTCGGEVRERTYSDEVAGVAVLFGGEVVEVSHVLVLGRETQKRANLHLLPGTQGREDVFSKLLGLGHESPGQGLWDVVGR